MLFTSSNPNSVKTCRDQSNSITITSFLFRYKKLIGFIQNIQAGSIFNNSFLPSLFYANKTLICCFGQTQTPLSPQWLSVMLCPPSKASWPFVMLLQSLYAIPAVVYWPVLPSILYMTYKSKIKNKVPHIYLFLNLCVPHLFCIML